MPHADFLSLGEQALARAKISGATEADVVLIGATELSAGIRNGEPETISRAESRGLGLRVFVGDGSATLSTSDVSAAAIERLAEQAVAIARIAPADPFAALADAASLAQKIPELDLNDTAEPSMEKLQESAKEAEAAGRQMKGITNSQGADAGFSRHEIALLTSTGFAKSYAASHHVISASLIAGSGADMQRDYDYAMAVHAADLPSPASVGKQAATRTVERMNPRKLTSRTLPVIFEPRVGKSLLSAFASAISGAAITRGTSFLKNDLGKEIFAPAITVTDDPLRKRGLASHPFDGEGVATKKQSIIKNGVLQTWLLDVRSANQLKLQTTGHASRGLTGAPHPSPSNMVIEPGELTPQQLTDLPAGIYVTETIGHGVNLITGDYSVGASGFYIEKGERIYPVSEITIAGNLRDMFKALTAANDLQYHYSINVPTLRVESMTVAGN